MARLTPDPGQSLALVALFCGVAAGVALKAIGPMPAGEAIALRSVLAFALIAGIIALRRRTTARGVGPRGMVRAGLDALAALTFSLAIFEIPLSLLASIHATLPVLSVILSGVVLKERLRAGNWAALALACCGTLMILQPGLAFSPLGITLALVSTLAYALRDVTTRRLPPQTDTFRIALVSLVLVGAVAAALPGGGRLGLAQPHRHPSNRAGGAGLCRRQRADHRRAAPRRTQPYRPAAIYQRALVAGL